MLRIFIRFSLLVLATLLTACGGGGSSDVSSTPTGMADWTYMVYMAGDNNLSAAAIEDINEMESVGSSARVNVVVQAEFSPIYSPEVPGLKGRDGIDIGLGGGTLIPLNTQPTVRGRIIRDFNTGVISSPLTSVGSNLDMGKAETLEAFIRWSKQNHPARHYALVLWSHGDGWKVRRDVGGIVSKGALADDSSGSFMSVQDIAGAIKNSGIKLELLNFDACLMAMYEVAHAFSGLADYLVASEEVEPSQGDDYTALLTGLQTDPAMSAESLGKLITRSYREYYLNDAGFRDDAVTKSLVKLSAIPSLQTAIEALGKYASDNLSTHRVALQTARSSSTAYQNRHSHDLGDFLDQLVVQPSVAADPVFRSRISGVRNALAQAVVDNRIFSGDSSSTILRSQGLAIFLPRNSQVTDEDLLAYDRLSSNQSGKTYWRNFVSLLVNGEVGGLLEKVPGNFAFIVRWDNPLIDMDLYISEPEDLYAPYMGIRTPNGFFTPDSSQSGIAMEGYVADEEVQKGSYDVFVNYYSGDGPTRVDLYYADALTPETKVETLVMPVAGLPPAPVASSPLTDAGIAAGSYGDWWYPGGTTARGRNAALMEKSYQLPDGRRVTLHFSERRAKFKRARLFQQGVKK